MRADSSQREHRERESSPPVGERQRGVSRTRVETAVSSSPTGNERSGPVSRERYARCLTVFERATRLLTSGDYGFFVGRGGTVGIGVRPTGGGVPNGFGLALGDSDGFGAKPQMLQLKRP